MRKLAVGTVDKSFRHGVVDVIIKKIPRPLRGVIRLAHHVLCDCRLGGIGAQHLQLAVNERGRPADVFWGHAPHKRRDLVQNRATTAPPITVRFPGAVQTKALAVPMPQRIGIESM
jgi:hypothetical protein